MTTHTPGPWRYEQSTRTIRSYPANYWLATVDSWDGAIKHQNDRNAKLMAAAPDLLSTMQGVLASIEEHIRILEKNGGGGFFLKMDADSMRAAIAKATGA